MPASDTFRLSAPAHGPNFKPRAPSSSNKWFITLDCSISLGQPAFKRRLPGEPSIKHLFWKSRKVLYAPQCFEWTLSENISTRKYRRPSKRMKFNLFNCKAFRKKKHVAQGGAILDQVISESCSPNNKVLLYKLANYKLGEHSITQFTWGGACGEIGEAGVMKCDVFEMIWAEEFKFCD